jgi:hypothetical protein
LIECCAVQSVETASVLGDPFPIQPTSKALSRILSAERGYGLPTEKVVD